MKKYGIQILLLLLAIVIGCSKDNGDSVSDPTPVDKSNNLKSTGVSANDILSNDNFDNLLIEIAYAEGMRPTSDAISTFESFLRKHTYKEQIEVIYNELDASGEDSLSLEKISDLESENRTAYNNDKTLAIYIYFADAPSASDEEDEDLVTLGAVYRNTSMVIHESTVRRLAGQSFLISNADIEAAALNHEFGHLFGLVNLGTVPEQNIGTIPVNDHEDTETANHCNVDGCLMRAELQFGGSSGKQAAPSHNMIASDIQPGCILSGKSILEMLEQQASKGLTSSPGLGVECVLDLQANGGK